MSIDKIRAAMNRAEGAAQAVGGVALLIALNYMIINTVVDILYGIIDPRVRCS